MKIVKLTIDETQEIEGIDAVALVEEPAIEMDFLMFSEHKFQSYNDYPQAARKAAEQGIKRNKELGNKCGTLVGKQRAQQLAQGKNITLDTIKRMRAFLIRQKDNYDLAVRRKDYNACGYISYLLWGGPAALPWAEKKLRQAGILEEQNEQIIRDYFAEIGPRGGIKESPKAPRSTTPGEGKRGSERNKPGAAGTTRGVKVPAKIEKSLQKKADDFNEKYKDKLGYGTSVAQLRTVYQRGIGAYQTSHSPNVRSAEQWAQARVNAYLYLVKNGRPQNKKYTSDFDLLPSKHPKSNKMSKQDYEVFSYLVNDIIGEEKPKAKYGFSAINQEQQILAGPLMIADKLIPRVDNEGNKYYVFFDAEGIKKLSYKLMQNKLIDSVNIEHDNNQKVSDISLVETWLVDDPDKDKSASYGYKLPKGSWFGVYKVNNKKVWDDYVKTGKVKGFSVEGIFQDKLILNNAITS